MSLFSKLINTVARGAARVGYALGVVDLIVIPQGLALGTKKALS